MTKPLYVDKPHVQNSSASNMKRIVLSSSFATGLFFTSPLLSEAALGDQALSEGMNDPDVKDLQKALKDRGHFNYHTATGYYGSITTEAVKAFQKANGLPATGNADLATLAQLTEDTQVSVSQASVSSSAASGTLQSNQVLRQGTTSGAVQELQQLLARTGHFNSNATGYYGRVTTEAVRAFQRQHNLSVDGIAGPQTITTLQNVNGRGSAAAPSQPAASAPTQAVSSQPTLRLNNQGDAVSSLQQKLKDLGYYTTSITGTFGPQTDSAVRDFQRAHNLAADGIVGANTYRALENARPKAQAPSTPPQAAAPDSSQQTSASSSILRIGTTSAAVTNMQAQLRTIGLFGQAPTGYYGTVTEQAVRAFQRQQGLTVDGIAGPATLGKLQQLAGTPSSTPSNGGGSSVGGFNMMNLIADASEQIGTPYVWGGTTASGFDCSGFIQFVFSKNGVQTPRTVAQMWSQGKSVSLPSVGDLVFFDINGTGASHAGIYIGSNQFIHSGSSTGVTIARTDTKYWNDRYIGAKRMH
ncbi:peptidoglycan-binding protein [Alkalihalophilus pseudofirmus]|uniref:C40 family peptidase n=1 Tax=Alkalihalophilus pseudofirmus TaxID=79885 RepID=UPI00259BCFB9|nr:peptidoglycan-binding protein [Alkalihalophilus pseudofirmus]WEG16719.1 peptidoglycan-binding protein [Alkalihalophilus pseudofirmus]